MNDYNDSHTGMIPPSKLAKSFFVVAGCYTLFVVFLFGTFIALAMVISPGVYEALQNPEAIQQKLNDDPESVLPRKLYWVWLSTNSVLCLMMGWVVGRMAPFAKFQHAVFLAILIFVSGLQQSIAAQYEIKWMFVLIMGVLPISILCGARLAVQAAMPSDEPETS